MTGPFPLVRPVNKVHAVLVAVHHHRHELIAVGSSNEFDHRLLRQQLIRQGSFHG
jgi:hypothetical protein